jgi:CDP-glucose 4,6-dehydratase
VPRFGTGRIEPDFWAGKRVFVTGHTGFKGSWLTLWLGRIGAQVTGYALAPERSEDLFNTVEIGGLCQSHIADIRDQASLSGTLNSCEPEIIFHLAAQPLVRRSYVEPIETFDVNVMGTAHLLQACRDLPNLKAAVVITTDKVYEDPESGRAFVEGDCLGGAEPYGYSKAAAEMVASAWRQAFLGAQGVALATARAGNVIGGGDWSEDRLVPDAIRAFSASEELIIRSPGAVRPWQHVVEPLAGYLLLAQALWDKSEAAQGWNFGPAADQCLSVEALVSELADGWGPGATWRADPPSDAPHEAATLLLDSAMAAEALGWESRLDVASALANTSAWYRAAAAGATASELRRIMVQEIDALTSQMDRG